MTGRIRYFHGPWPEKPVPDGEPAHLFYEVDVHGTVPRVVERYADGHSQRNSLELDGGPWGEVPSLVDMDWEQAIDGFAVEEISREAFEREWALADDLVRATG